MYSNISIKRLSPNSLALFSLSPFWISSVITPNMSSSRSIYTNASAQVYSVPSAQLPPVEKISSFHSSLPGYSPTALLPLPKIGKTLSIGNILVKDERTRFSLPSFKPLGIAWAIRNALIAELSETFPTPLSPDLPLAELASRVTEAQIKLIAATDGKLGRIVARLGKHFGVESINTRIFVSETLEEDVKEEIRREGAEIITVQGDFEVAVREAWLHSVATDGVLISIDAEENYEDIPKWITQGYATIFQELSTQLSSSSPPDVLILPVGIGGLAQAAVTHYKALSEPSDQRPYIVTVEPEAAACLHSSLHAGTRTAVDASKETILKSLNYREVAESAWEVLRDGVDVSTVVSDPDVLQATEELKNDGVEAGFCSAAVLAALKNLIGDNRVAKDLSLNQDSTVVLVFTDCLES